MTIQYEFHMPELSNAIVIKKIMRMKRIFVQYCVDSVLAYLA